MRTLRNLLFVSAFSVAATMASANVSTVMAKPENKQIRDLLESIHFEKFIKAETKINISFFVNSKNELIVVSTNNQELDQLVKSALNYQKIVVSDLDYNKVYTIPVVIR